MISDAVMVALIAGIPPTLAAIGALMVALRTSKKADDNGKKLDDNTKKIESNGAEVAAVKEIAERSATDSKRSKEEIDMMRTGAFMLGVRQERKRESDFQRLHGKSSDLGSLD